MRLLSEIKGEEAIDVTAEIVGILSDMFGNKEVQKMRKEKKTLSDIFSYVLKHNRKDVVKMLSLLDGSTQKEYLNKTNMATLLHDIDVMIGDPTVKELFMLQSQSADSVASGSVTEDTQDKA